MFFCLFVFNRRAAVTLSCRWSWSRGRRGLTLAQNEAAWTSRGFHLLFTLQLQQLLQSIDSRAHGNVVNMFNCIFIISQCVCIQVFSYLIMLLVFFYHLMRFSRLNMNLCTVLCVWVCARMCMQDKHATYLFLQAVWSTFILSVHVAAVYWM